LHIDNASLSSSTSVNYHCVRVYTRIAALASTLCDNRDIDSWIW
jgi:hypothetical protein